MTGWPFDGAPRRVRLDADLHAHAKAGEVRIVGPVSSPARTLGDVLADLARLSKAGHADYDFDVSAAGDRPLRMVGADRGMIEERHRTARERNAGPL